jgi:SulP family sulfate permease
LTAAERLAALIDELAQAGIAIKIADAPRPFREEMNRVGLTDQLGQQQFYVSVKTAVEAYQQQFPTAMAEPVQPSQRRSGIAPP